jgi:nucleoside recognition membrane protein YjiH
MNPRNRTIIFIVLVIIAIFAYDAFTIVKDGVHTSVSQVLIDWAYQFPVSSFLMGFAMGHLYWKISVDKKGIN